MEIGVLPLRFQEEMIGFDNMGFESDFAAPVDRHLAEGDFDFLPNPGAIRIGHFQAHLRKSLGSPV